MTTAQEREELCKLADSSINEAQTELWYESGALERHSGIFVADAEYIGAVSPIVLLSLLDDIDRLTAEVETLKSNARTDEILLGAAQDAASRLTAQLEQYKADAALDKVAIFKGQHQFLEWNRQQDVSLVKIAYEYGVFEKAIELYSAAMKGQP